MDSCEVRAVSESFAVGFADAELSEDTLVSHLAEKVLPPIHRVQEMPGMCNVTQKGMRDADRL